MSFEFLNNSNSYTAKVFEIERYIGWGTPKDYEEYQNTVKYWKEFVQSKGYLGE